MHIQGIAPVAGYRAGACNIGPEETARRRRAAAFGVIATVVVVVGLVAVGAPPAARLLLFPVLAATLVSVEQVRRRFCVRFGIGGQRNFGALGREERIADATERATDRRAALVIIGYCSLIAFAVTLAFVALSI